MRQRLGLGLSGVGDVMGRIEQEDIKTEQKDEEL